MATPMTGKACDISDDGYVCITHRRTLLECVADLQAQLTKWQDDYLQEQAAHTAAARRAETAERERDTATVMWRLETAQRTIAVARLRSLEGALGPLVAFIRAWDSKPIGSIADEFYAIHTGTQWEASLRLSDLRRLATLTPAPSPQGDAAPREDARALVCWCCRAPATWSAGNVLWCSPCWVARCTAGLGGHRTVSPPHPAGESAGAPDGASPQGDAR